MKDASRVMYVIGRVFSIIEIVCTSLLFLVAIAMIADPARFVDALNQADPSRVYTATKVAAFGVTLLVGMLFAVALTIVTLVLANKSIAKLDNGDKTNNLHIAMIVLGVFNSIFYLLGGIFAVIYNGQNTTPAQTEQK